MFTGPWICEKKKKKSLETPTTMTIIIFFNDPWPKATPFLRLWKSFKKRSSPQWSILLIRAFRLPVIAYIVKATIVKFRKVIIILHRLVPVHAPTPSPSPSHAAIGITFGIACNPIYLSVLFWSMQCNFHAMIFLLWSILTDAKPVHKKSIKLIKWTYVFHVDVRYHGLLFGTWISNFSCVTYIVYTTYIICIKIKIKIRRLIRNIQINEFLNYCMGKKSTTLTSYRIYV